eukprot:Gregarina_sp_Poly_1__10115@NODE_68_length_16344_cov_127_756773_g58_i0_p4_GENE_NODE_68_length_16344_cov_127_756773_g58_i0NODE_68_length_16344_cov_127_756773_g58_i0_p4_ORF_typecomplete_len656_score85_00Glyco_transf_92/PF01697_27/5_7e20Glyco_transf_92/PF01697_27/2_9e03Glyco_tranf_2_4/PF13704_6/1_2e09_NODE_68_length_16344_cov_127_756773_g58_i040325999
MRISLNGKLTRRQRVRSFHLWLGHVRIILGGCAILASMFLFGSLWYSRDISLDLQRKQFRIGVCTQVLDEAQYLLEWIEFHRLQGVDKFVIYFSHMPRETFGIDTNARVWDIVNLYSSHGHPELIELHHVLSLAPDWSAPLLFSHVANSMPSNEVLHRLAIVHCFNSLRDRAHYVAVLDVDEFMYVPRSNLWRWLRRQRRRNPSISTFSAEHRNFGVGANVLDPHIRTQTNPVSGEVQVWFDPRDSSAVSGDLRVRNPLGVDGLWRNDSLIQALLPETPVTAADPAALNELHRLRTKLLEMLKQDQTLDSRLALDTARLYREFSLQLNQRKKRLQSWVPEREFDETTSLFDLLLNITHSPEIGLPSETAELSENRFPLVSVEQQWTRPVSRFDEIYRDSLSNLSLSAAAWPSLLAISLQTMFPSCAESNSTGWTAWHCNNLNIYWETSNGKSVYSTEKLDLSLRESNPSARNCLRPAIHRCAQGNMVAAERSKTYSATNLQSDILRVDHHPWRSFEKRHTKLLVSRGGPFGHSDKTDYAQWVVWKSLKRDSQKLVLARQISQRLEKQFNLLPTLFNLTKVWHRPQISYEPNFPFNCNPRLLERQMQILCNKKCEDPTFTFSHCCDSGEPLPCVSQSSQRPGSVPSPTCCFPPQNT